MISIITVKWQKLVCFILEYQGYSIIEQRFDYVVATKEGEETKKYSSEKLFLVEKEFFVLDDTVLNYLLEYAREEKIYIKIQGTYNKEQINNVYNYYEPKLLLDFIQNNEIDVVAKITDSYILLSIQEPQPINENLKKALKLYKQYKKMEGQKFDDGASKQAEGQKFDDGKLPLFTVLFKQFPNALREVVRCSNSGHNKYPNDTDWMNFKRVDLSKNPDRYLNAGTRHLMESKGELLWNEDMEEYGGALHLAQSIWNQLAHLELKLNSNNSDESL